MITVVSSVSARPNFVKLAAVHHALMQKPGVRHIIVHTGQHYDPLLSDIFFEQLKIPDPDFSLGVKGAATREETICATAHAFTPILENVKPDIVLVYGDVNGAVGAARAAKKLRIKIGHVEAGLRSFDRDMPEELNRIEIDRLSQILFCTERSAMRNLFWYFWKKKILVGNTMIDTLIRMTPAIDAARMDVDLDLPERYAVATLHRPSNVDDIDDLWGILGLLGKVNKSMPIVFPIHPRLRQKIEKSEYTTTPISNIARPIDPLGYLPFLHLMKSAEFILTDSGGIQEEATFLQKRCFTLRRNTERPATVASGSNVLINPENESDRKKVFDFAAKPSKISVKIPEKWDGKAGERIADILVG